MASNTTQKARANHDSEQTRSMKLVGHTVIVSFDIRKERGGEAVNLTAHLDFEGVPIAQIMFWAARTKIIDLQNALRLCDLEFIKDLAKRGPIMRKAVEAGTGFVSTEKIQQQIVSRFAGLSPEEREATIRLLKANM